MVSICQRIALIPLTVVIVVISVLLSTVLYSALNCEFLNKLRDEQPDTSAFNSWTLRFTD